MLRVIGVVVGAALILSGLALAASQSETYKFTSKLTAGAEVPKPKGVPASATGTFTATTVEPKTGKVHLTWKLTFSHLSGKALQAHIHLGKPGKAGNVLVALCAPCKSGQTGKAAIARSVENALEAGKTYVNIHTAKNLAGEIRGQVKEATG
jgi:CHRD domain-containing protein